MTGSKITLQYEDETQEIIHTHNGDEHYTKQIQGFVNFLRGIGYDVPEDYDTV